MAQTELYRDQVRELFSRASDDSKAIAQLKKLLDQAPAENVYQAYKGIVRAMGARDYFNPLKKLGAFQEGTALIEQAVQTDPDNSEIRFVRFMLQKSAPPYLGYNTALQEDYQHMLQGVEESEQRANLGDWLPKIIGVLLKSDLCTAQDRQRLEAVLR